MKFQRIQFFSGLKAENAAQVIYDLLDIKPGEVKELGRSWIYRRTAKDIEYIDRIVLLTDDPHSVKSEQPDTVLNKWRSQNDNFFIFLPYAPVRGCPIEFIPANSVSYQDYEDGKAIQKYNHFRDSCEWRLFDTSGRILSRKNWPLEKNLIVPEVKWLSNTRIIIFKG